MQEQRTIKIGNRTIGPNRPVYFIAEAGSNHDRDLEQAKRLIEVAAEAGADAVKFQTFRADRLYPKSAGMTDYLDDPRPIHEIIKALEMPLEWIPELAAAAKKLGLDFLSTPFDLDAVGALAPYVPAIKIASYEMTYHELVRHAARTGKPLIMSTGTARLDEVREAVAAARAAGCEDLVVLQCTAKYPAPLTALNLRAMTVMAAELGTLVGLSDHSREPLPGPLAATAMGAVVIEKHFTLSNRLPGPDHAYALEPAELIETIRQVRAVERALGNGIKEPQPEEAELRAFARRTLFTVTNVAASTPLTVDNTGVLRCGKLPYGLHPADHLSVIGRRARRDLSAETPFKETDLEPLRLEAEEVALRPVATEDAEPIVTWRNQPDAARQLFAPPPTLESHRSWFAGLRAKGDRVEFMVERAGVAVGTVGFASIDLIARTATFGILLSEEARGHGIGERASRLALSWAFGALRLEKVELEAFADNAPALALYDRLGFVVTERSARLKDGVERPTQRMTLVRSAAGGLAE